MNNKADKFIRIVSILAVVIIFICAATTVFSLLTVDVNQVINGKSSSSSSISTSSSYDAGDAVGQAIGAGCGAAVFGVVMVLVLGASSIAYTALFIVALVSLIRANTAKKAVKSPAIIDLVVSIIALAVTLLSGAIMADFPTIHLILGGLRVVSCIALFVMSIIGLVRYKKQIQSVKE